MSVEQEEKILVHSSLKALELDLLLPRLRLLLRMDMAMVKPHRLEWDLAHPTSMEEVVDRIRMELHLPRQDHQ
jgi:hypothetical protein